MIFKVLCLMFAMLNATSFSLAKRSFHTTRISMLNVGDVAPDFALKNLHDKVFKLSDYKGKKSVVVFFYPKDSTPGCTTQACTFEKRFPEFQTAQSAVFGVSSGGKEDKEKFIRNNKLNSIELLMDEDNAVRKAWKVPRAMLGILPGRVTYVVGKDGLVKSVYDDIGNTDVHVERALEAVKEDK